MTIKTFIDRYSNQLRIAFFVFVSIFLIFLIVSITRTIFPKNTASKVEQEIQKTVEKVGKLMVLPAENPTVATVSDITKLPPGQPFFAPAQNGDVVLFYNDAKKVILYRPSTDKIISIGPITVAQ